MYVEGVKRSSKYVQLQILYILKHVGDVGDRSSTPKGCNAMYVGDVRDRNNLQYT